MAGAFARGAVLSFCAAVALVVGPTAACSSAGVGSGGAAGDISVEPVDRVRVIRVFDGDTVEVRFADGAEKKVRLIGIDSPEMDDEREDVLFFAHMARRFAFHHLYDKTVGLAYDWERTDAYGRTLAYVVVEDGTLFNERIIREGFAYAFTRYPYRDDLKALFREAQREAQRSARGLWREEPWPVVGPADARSHLGRIATVSFVCKNIVE
ncbi:MAG: thermonuclease family protein, partial [Candidatus Aminicenantes bacterium]|nr:thermonuclease family protein [Candidatus Aminicenantes bacterium]